MRTGDYPHEGLVREGKDPPPVPLPPWGYSLQTAITDDASLLHGSESPKYGDLPPASHLFLYPVAWPSPSRTNHYLFLSRGGVGLAELFAMLVYISAVIMGFYVVYHSFTQ